MALNQGGPSDRFLDKPDEGTFIYKSIDKHDLVIGRCICSRCEAMVKQFYYIKEETARIHCALCVDCALELNPPKWQLIIATINSSMDNRIEPVGNYDIWDETHKRRELTLTLKELIECGWFIRKVTETLQPVPRRIVKKIDLEYYGRLTCLRFKDHYEELGLGSLDKCKSPFCEFVYEKTRMPFDKLAHQDQCHW